jgi:hypothetical protein
VPELPDLSRATALEPLVDRLMELDSPARVAIDGPDAAGKTTLGQELATLLAERTPRRLGHANGPMSWSRTTMTNGRGLVWRKGVLPRGA